MCHNGVKLFLIQHFYLNALTFSKGTFIFVGIKIEEISDILTYSYLSNKRVGYNKRVGLTFSSNLING